MGVGDIWGIRLGIRCPDVGAYYFMIMFGDFWEAGIGVSNKSKDVYCGDW